LTHDLTSTSIIPPQEPLKRFSEPTPCPGKQYQVVSFASWMSSLSKVLRHQLASFVAVLPLSQSLLKHTNKSVPIQRLEAAHYRYKCRFWSSSCGDFAGGIYWHRI